MDFIFGRLKSFNDLHGFSSSWSVSSRAFHPRGINHDLLCLCEGPYLLFVQNDFDKSDFCRYLRQVGHIVYPNPSPLCVVGGNYRLSTEIILRAISEIGYTGGLYLSQYGMKWAVSSSLTRFADSSLINCNSNPMCIDLG